MKGAFFGVLLLALALAVASIGCGKAYCKDMCDFYDRCEDELGLIVDEDECIDECVDDYNDGSTACQNAIEDLANCVEGRGCASAVTECGDEEFDAANECR